MSTSSPLCIDIFAAMHPAPEQMMGNCEGVRSGKAIGVLSRDHQSRLVAGEPARVLKFHAIDDDVLVGGTRSAADHQRRRIGPGLRHVVADVGAADSRFLEYLAPDRILDSFGRFDKA